MIFELVQTGSGFALLTQSAFSDELSVWAVIKEASGGQSGTYCLLGEQSSYTSLALRLAVNTPNNH